MPNSLPYDLAGKRVWVAGHRGMVGRALMRRLAQRGCSILTVEHATVDLTRQVETELWLAENRPQVVFLAAARVGGIAANDAFRAEFLYDNLMIEANVLNAAHAVGVEKLLLLGSSCIYPKFAEQPIHEEALLTGPLEATNEPYAIAKIAGLKLVEAYRRQFGADFISAMPTNLYGPFDNFDLQTSHVLPALIRKAHEARERGDEALVIWGTGTVRREFLHVDDCADALIFLMQRYSDDLHLNVGCGQDLTIAALAGIVCEVVGFEGSIVTDPSKPDGTPRKLMSGERLKQLGWEPKISLRDGIGRTYRWFLENSSVKTFS